MERKRRGLEPEKEHKKRHEPPEGIVYSIKPGVDKDGVYFAIPEAEIDLLAAMIKSRKESIDGEGQQVVSETYVTRWSNEKNDFLIALKPGYLRGLSKEVYSKEQFVWMSNVDNKLKPSGYGLNGKFRVLFPVEFG